MRKRKTMSAENNGNLNNLRFVDFLPNKISVQKIRLKRSKAKIAY